LFIHIYQYNELLAVKAKGSLMQLVVADRLKSNKHDDLAGRFGGIVKV
jgi:hypothetical protein